MKTWICTDKDSCCEKCMIQCVHDGFTPTKCLVNGIDVKWKTTTPKCKLPPGKLLQAFINHGWNLWYENNALLGMELLSPAHDYQPGSRTSWYSAIVLKSDDNTRLPDWCYEEVAAE